MRYLAALIIGIVALFVVNAFVDLFAMPRPWNAFLIGGVFGVTMVIVLLVWEVVRPTHRDEPAKPKMTEDERARARAERRARLAAEAGVSPLHGDDEAVRSDEPADADGRVSRDSTEGAPASRGPSTSHADETSESAPVKGAATAGVSREDETTAGARADHEDADGPGIDHEDVQMSDGNDHEDADGDGIDHEDAQMRDEDSEVVDEAHDDAAQGSSLESPPVGQPGVSADALRGESDSADSGTEPVSETDSGGADTVPGGADTVPSEAEAALGETDGADDRADDGREPRAPR